VSAYYALAFSANHYRNLLKHFLPQNGLLRR